MKSNPSTFKMLSAFCFAICMVMPAAVFVGIGTDSGVSTEVISPGMDFEHRVLVDVDQNLYEVWIEGMTHETHIMFSSSSNYGQTWSQPVQVTDDSYVPMNVQMYSTSKSLHLVWMDGVYRQRRTCYSSFDLAEQDWSKPRMFEGENPALATLGETVAIATKNCFELSLYLSKNDGQSFETHNPINGMAVLRPAVLLESGIINLAYSGGFSDPTTGMISAQGIYITSNELGMWKEPLKVAYINAQVREISMERVDGSLNVRWTESTAASSDSYLVVEKASETFGEKTLISSEIKQVEPPEAIRAPTRLPPKKWTFICYLDADNNLAEYGAHDVDEMELVGSTDDVNILCLLDLDNQGEMTETTTRFYYIEYDTNMASPDPPLSYTDTSTIVSPQTPLSDINASWGTELNMGDPQTAIDLMNYVYVNYPADHYYWDFWDHGGTWTYMQCSDDTDSDELTAAETRHIYEQLRLDNPDRKVLWDINSMDECILAEVCVAYDSKQYADYMAYSEDNIAGDGYEYDDLLQHVKDNPDMNGEEFAFWTYKAYRDHYGAAAGATFSIINNTAFDYELMPAINSWGQKMRHKASTLNTEIKNSFTAAKSFSNSYMRDLRDLALNMQTNIPAATDPEIYDATTKVLTMTVSNDPTDVYGSGTWVSDRAIMIHNSNTDEHGIEIYGNQAYNTLYDTMMIAPETNWDALVQEVWAVTPTDVTNEEPTCQITSPSEGSYVVLDNIAIIEGTSGDSDGAVQRVEVKIDRESWETASDINPWSYSWDTTGWAPGSHRITARAYDSTDYSEGWDCINLTIIVDPTLPDLSIVPADISFDNPTPNEGDQVNITATTWNLNSDPGAQDAGNATHPVQIGFYVGNPMAGGTLLGIEDTTPSILPEGTSGTASITWFTDGYAGYHDIYAVADPSFMIPELTDSNNSASKAITVAGYNVDLLCAQNTSTVQAGMSHDYEIKVTNTGTMTDTITLSIDNPTGWRAHFNNNPPSKASEGDGPSSGGRSLNYRSYNFTVAEMYDIQAAHPDIVNVTVIGTSWEGRDIHAVKVSDNVALDENEPEVLIMGMHHAREWMTVEVPMYYLNDLVSNYGTDARTTWMVENREIFIVPIVNPDGYVYSQEVENMWRKNRRDNGDGTFGVDPNRNYDGAQNNDTNGDWGGAGASHTTSDDTYCGPAPFSEPCTQAIRDLVLARDFQVTISYHSYGQEIYWPWGYDTGVQAPHHTTQQAIAQDMAAMNGYDPMQSAVAYPTTGDTDDWVYGHNWYNLGRFISAHTIELDTAFQPPVTQIRPTCELNLDVNYFATEVADNLYQDSPTLTHTPLNDTVDTTGPYTVSVDITTPHGLAPGETKLFWRNTGAWNEVVMTNTVGDTWEGDIPGQSDGTWVHYYIETEDVNTDRSSEPPYTPYADHDFFVGNDVVTYDVTLDSLDWTIVNFTVEAPVTALPSEFAVIDVIGTSNNDPSKTDSVETITTVAPGILVIDDDPDEDSTVFITDALDNNGYAYDLEPYSGSLVLDDYRIVIWDVGDEYSGDHFSTSKQSEAASFMDGGGSLYICGAEIGYDIGTSGAGESPGAFIWDYLHADYLVDNPGDTIIDGVALDEISDGFAAIDMTTAAGLSTNRDGIAPAPGADAIFYDTAVSDCYGVKCDAGTYKVVYTSFAFAQFSNLQAERDLLIYRILEWLNPDSPPVVTLFNPAGSEEVFSGVIDITWTASDDMGLPVGCIDLYYSDDLGGIWTPIVMGLDNTGSYLWDTVAAGIPDGVSYMVRIDVTDSIDQPSSDQSPECFSVDNTADDRWYLQVESTNLGTYLDLDMKPSELTAQEISIAVTAPGDILVQDFASEYVATDDVDLAGDWTFTIYGKVTSSVADGNLYAEVYADDGTPRLLFTTDYDDELVGSHLMYHQFSWPYTVPASTLINAGEHVVVHVMLHATAGAATSPHYHYANADIPVFGTVANDYTDTVVSDNTREGIMEVDGGGAPGTYLSEDFAGGIPGDWTIVDGGTGTGPAQTWTTANPGGRIPSAPITDPFAIVDSDNHGFEDMDEELITRLIDLSGTSSVSLEFDQYFNQWGAEICDVDVRSANTGGAWTNVFTQSGADSPDPDHQNIDITTEAADAVDVQIRFHYYNANYEYYWMIDNILVQGSIATSLLEHKWTVDVPAGETPYEFYVEARRTNNAEGDNFVFAYSTDNVSYTDMVTVNSATDSPYTYSLPALAGTVYIRVRDTDRTSGNTNLDTVEIDQMYISSVGGPPQFTVGLDYLDTPSYVEPVLTPTSLPTYDIDLTSVVADTWVFVSFPIEATGNVTTVFDDAVHGDGGTTWDYIQWYDNLNKEWRSYSIYKPASINDVDVIDNSCGYWIHITGNVGDQLLTVGSGVMPAGPVFINLYTGWNLVGFPSATTEKAINTLPPEADMISIYDLAQQYRIRDVTNLNGPDAWMVEGEAYWVRVTGNCVWTVNP